MNPTIPQSPGTCPGCAALQQQIEALDRGLVEAGTTASRALAAVESLERWRDAQEEAWRLFREGSERAAAGRATAQQGRRRGSRRGRRASGRHLKSVQS